MTKRKLLKELDRLDAETTGMPLMRINSIRVAREMLQDGDSRGKNWAKKVIEKYSDTI